MGAFESRLSLISGWVGVIFTSTGVGAAGQAVGKFALTKLPGKMGLAHSLDQALARGIASYNTRAIGSGVAASWFTSRSGAVSRAFAPNSALSRGAQLRQKYGHWSPAERQARIAQLSEANAERWVRNLENRLGSHFVEKHAPASHFDLILCNGPSMALIPGRVYTAISPNQVLSSLIGAHRCTR